MRHRGHTSALLLSVMVSASVNAEGPLEDQLQNAASDALVAGKHATSIALLNAAVSEMDPTDSSHLAEIHRILAVAFSAQGNYLQAVEESNRSLRLLASEVAPISDRIRVKRGLASDLDRLGRFDEARVLWNDVVEISKEAGSPAARAEALVMIADHLMASSHPTEASVQYSLAIKIKKELNKATWFIEQQRAKALAAAGQFELAIRAQRTAIGLASSYGIPSEMRSRWLEELGDLHRLNGDNQGAAGIYEAAFEAASDQQPGQQAVLLHKMLLVARAEKSEQRAENLETRLRELLVTANFLEGVVVREPVFLGEKGSQSRPE